MTDEQLRIMVERTGSDRLLSIVSDANPDEAEREWHREWVRNMAALEVWPPPDPNPPPPSLVAKAVGLTKAAATFLASGCAVVDRAEFDRRHAICEACPLFDAARDRCTVCTCNMAVKPWGRDMKCPKGHW